MSEAPKKRTYAIPVVDNAELAARLASRKLLTQLHFIGPRQPDDARCLRRLRSVHGRLLDLNGVFRLREAFDPTLFLRIGPLQAISLLGCEPGDAVWGSLKHQYNSLSVLVAESIGIGARGAAGLADQFPRMPVLTTLTIGNNRIGPEGVATLAEQFEHVPSLTTLGLYGNGICDEGTMQLVEHFRHIPNLTTLDLAQNEISAEGAAKLAKELAYVPNLTTLSLFMNRIGSEGVDELARHFEHIRNLTTLLLGHNNIGPRGIESLADGFALVPNLANLSLNKNEIGPECVETLATQFLHVPNLAVLDLNDNEIGSEGAAMLAKQFARIPNLTALSLDHNLLGLPGVTALAEHLGSVPNLKRLSLNRNRIDPMGVARLAEQFWRLPNLTLLGLSYNILGDAGMQLIAKHYQDGTLSHLYTLWVTGNNIRYLDEALLSTGDAVRILHAALYGRSLPHVRLVLIGMGGVGKSLLARRTFLNQVQSEGKHDETHDIVVLRPEECNWMPPIDPGQNAPEPTIQTWIWDFAGQLLTHGVHESFLTDDGRTVYVIVLAADREPDHENAERGENRLRYWLQMLRYTVGSTAPLIIVVTRNDKCRTTNGKRPVDSPLDWPEWPAARSLPEIAKEEISRLMGVNLVDVALDFSACDASYPIEEGLHRILRDATYGLDVVHGRKVPAELTVLKAVVDSRLTQSTMIPREEYDEWCANEKVEDEETQCQVLRMLHHMGSVIYWGQTTTERDWQGDEDGASSRLRVLGRAAPVSLQTHLLNPKWFRRCVYAVTRASEEMVGGKPRLRLTALDIDRIVAEASVGLQSTSNAVEGGVIREALTFIGVCWQDSRGNFLFPRGLPELVDITRYTSGEPTQLIWDFLPEHCVAKLLVRLHLDEVVVSRKKGSHVHGPSAALIEYPHDSGVETFVFAVPAEGQIQIFYGEMSTGAQRQTVLTYLLTLLQSYDLQGRKPDKIIGALHEHELSARDHHVPRLPAPGEWKGRFLENPHPERKDLTDLQLLTFYGIGVITRDEQQPPASQREIAERLNRDPSFISKFKADLMKSLNKKYGVPVDEEILIQEKSGAAKCKLSTLGIELMDWIDANRPDIVSDAKNTS
jgi:Ran GTPase-activating protein (RanGAP) involved in mRNA processing and transport